MTAPTDIQEQLRRAILTGPMTRYALAKLSDVSQPVLSQFVRGNRSITMDTAAKIAAALGLRLVGPEKPARKAGKDKEHGKPRK